MPAPKVTGLTAASSRKTGQPGLFVAHDFPIDPRFLDGQVRSGQWSRPGPHEGALACTALVPIGEELPAPLDEDRPAHAEREPQPDLVRFGVRQQDAFAPSFPHGPEASARVRQARSDRPAPKRRTC